MNFNIIVLKMNTQQIKLLFADTDSLIYEIKIGDICEDFNRDKEM